MIAQSTLGPVKSGLSGSGGGSCSAATGWSLRDRSGLRDLKKWGACYHIFSKGVARVEGL